METLAVEGSDVDELTNVLLDAIKLHFDLNEGDVVPAYAAAVSLLSCSTIAQEFGEPFKNLTIEVNDYD